MYILSMDEESPASGQLLVGDEVVGVDGRSLLNKSHSECLQALRNVQGSATLTIRRPTAETVVSTGAQLAIHELL